MPDFAGGFLSPFLAAFDPDGEKTDQLMGKGKKKKKRGAPGGGGGGDVGDPNDQPGPNEGGDDWGQAHDDAGVPDSGGYWEYPTFGGPAIWHPASFSHGYKGGPNMDTFNPDNGNPPPGGGPYIGGDPSQGRYAMGNDPGAPAEPPMGRGGTSYYYDGEDPRTGDPHGAGGDAGDPYAR